jgi:hypothetical protein
MLRNLLAGLPTMIACLILQSLLVVTAIKQYRSRRQVLNEGSFWRSSVLVAGVMLLLIFGSLAQIGVWALLFQLLREFPNFGEAFYHSAVNFATLGYGDVVMSAAYRLLGPLEAINGAMMIGVSTAALTAVFQNFILRQINIEQ